VAQGEFVDFDVGESDMLLQGEVGGVKEGVLGGREVVAGWRSKVLLTRLWGLWGGGLLVLARSLLFSILLFLLL
jgi:hypothetical protein